MEKARRHALMSGDKSDGGGATNSSSSSSYSNVEAVEAVGSMLRAHAAAGASATPTSVNTTTATDDTTATDTAAAKLVKRGAAGGSAPWVGNALSAKNNGTDRNGGRKRQKQEHPATGVPAQDENGGSENAVVAMACDESYQERSEDRVVLQDLDTLKACPPEPDRGFHDLRTSLRPMCSDAGPGAPDFSSAAHNKSIPEQTSNDIRKFKSLAANTRASRPEGVRLRRAPSKFTDAEGDETPAGKSNPPCKAKAKAKRGGKFMPRTFAEIAEQKKLDHQRHRKVQGERSAHIFCTPAEGATLVDCDCTYQDYVRHIERSKTDFVVKELDRSLMQQPMNRIAKTASSNAVVADAMTRAGLSGSLASSVANFKARNKKGAPSAQRALVSDINENLISLMKGIARAAAAGAVAQTTLDMFCHAQAEMSWYLSLIDDSDVWDDRVRSCQACVVCGQTEKPLALEELNCVVCQCRIAKGDIYCFAIKDNCGVRCVTHRSTKLKKQQLDDMEDCKHAPRLDAFTQCNRCLLYVHHTCGMSNRAADPTERETYICCGCRVRHAADLVKEVGQIPEGPLIRIGKPAGSGRTRTAQGFPVKHVSKIEAYQNPKPDSLLSIEHTHMSAATEGILRAFLQAAGQRKISKEISFRELSHRYIKYIDRGALRTPMRFRGELDELRELPPAKFMRTFYGLFWKIDGVDALVFAVTTQTTDDGDLYVEYMDSVNLLPLGLLRPDLHRLVVTCIIGHQRALNSKSGKAGCEVKLWSFPATKAVCYLLHVHPKDMKNLEKVSLRAFYRDTFTASQRLGLTSACLAPTPPYVEGSGGDALCVLASRHVPVNGYIDTRMGEVASTAKNMVDKPEILSSCRQKTSAACSNIMDSLDKFTADRAGPTGGNNNFAAFVLAISRVRIALNRVKLQSAGELMQSAGKLMQSAGELMRRLREAAATLADAADQKRVNDIIQAGMCKLAKIHSGLLEQAHPPADMILLQPSQSQHQLTLQLFRGSCIDDAPDIFCARMTTDEASTICAAEGVAGRRAAPEEDVEGGTHAMDDLDLSAAVHVGRGPTGTGRNSAGEDGVGDPMEVDEEENAVAPAAPAAPADATAAAATTAVSCAKGVAQSRPSLLLQPTEAVRGVLDGIAKAMRSAVARPDEDRGRKSRPLFDSATALLKLCEERGLQFDTPVNARYSTSMLLYFCNRPESLRWVCFVCLKAITKGVRFCCHTHAKNMCEKCAADQTRSLACSPGCATGLVPRDVIAIESSSSSPSSSAEAELILSVGAGTSAAAAPRQTGRRTRSSTS